MRGGRDKFGQMRQLEEGLAKIGNPVGSQEAKWKEWDLEKSVLVKEKWEMGEGLGGNQM